MKGSIITDIATAAKLIGEIRKAQKDGASAVQIKPVYTVKCFTFAPAYFNTMEGCQTHKLGRDIDLAVMEVFNSLPYEVQRRLECAPDEPSGWVERARFWQQHLRPVLPPKMYHSVMALLIHWYIHCLRRRKVTTA